MLPISTDFAIPDIVGRQLNQIGVGKWDVQFHFESRTIQAMGRVDVLGEEPPMTVFDGGWLDISPLQRLVGLEAVSWARLDDRSFEVGMQNGEKIVFFSADHPWEDIVVHPEMWIF